MIWIRIVGIGDGMDLTADIRDSRDLTADIKDGMDLTVGIRDSRGLIGMMDIMVVMDVGHRRLVVD